MKDDNHFRRLWDLGYRRLVPIVPPDAPLSERSSLFKRMKAGKDARGKVPGICRDGLWSGFDWMSHETTEADLDRWHAMGAGVGIRLGPVGVHYLVNVDCDTRRVEDAKVVIPIAEKHFGKCAVRVGKEPKFSIPILTDPMPYTRFDYGDGDRIEILTDGRQFIAHGIHPATGRPYKWPRGLPPIVDLPYRTPAQLQAFLDECRELLPDAKIVITEGGSAGEPVDPETLRGNPDTVQSAVAKIRNTSERFPAREDYIRFGYALRGALPDDLDLALTLFLDWCARWEDGDNEPDEAAADFARMKERPRIGASYLYELAGMPPGIAVAERFFDPNAFSEASSIFPTEPAAPAKTFRFTPFGEAASTALTTAAKPLIKGVLDQGAMTVLYGESNAGKTFVAMDIAYHIARGLDWAGKRVAAFPVLYVAAEGGQGARKRAAALAARYGDAEGFHFLLSPVNLLRADADLQPLISAIRGVGQVFGLVVIDTLSRAMAGGDENASTDMGAMVKHLDALRHATGAHLLTVHHSGKDRAKGARGHSLLRAATDTEIEVVDRQIAVTKQRDLDGSFCVGFELDVVTLGVDGDGDPVTSCTVRLVAREAASVVRATEREAKVAEAVEDLDDGEGVTAEDVAGAFEARGEKLSKEAARALLKSLVDKNHIEKIGRGRWKKVVGFGSTTLFSSDEIKGEVVESGGSSGGSVFA